MLVRTPLSNTSPTFCQVVMAIISEVCFSPGRRLASGKAVLLQPFSTQKGGTKLTAFQNRRHRPEMLQFVMPGRPLSQLPPSEPFSSQRRLAGYPDGSQCSTSSFPRTDGRRTQLASESVAVGPSQIAIFASRGRVKRGRPIFQTTLAGETENSLHCVF